MGVYVCRGERQYFIEDERVYTGPDKLKEQPIDPITLEFSQERKDRIEREKTERETTTSDSSMVVVLGAPGEEKPPMSLASIKGNTANVEFEIPPKPVEPPKDIEEDVKKIEDDKPLKHSCDNKGRGGRLAPEGECPRCDELRRRK